MTVFVTLMMLSPILSVVSQSWCNVIVKQPLCALLQSHPAHQGMMLRDHHRCVIPQANHNGSSPRPGKWKLWNPLISDDRPLAVTLICRLWEGGLVTLSTT